MKKMICAVVSFFLITVFIMAKAMDISYFNIRIGNECVSFTYPTFIQNDRVYVPLRELCEKLQIPVHWDEQKNEVHLDVSNQQIQISDKTRFKEEGVLPDKETAYIVGKIVLEKYIGKSLEFEEDDKVYYLNTTLDKSNNTWCVYQTFKYKDAAKKWAASGNIYTPTVILNKQTGKVLYINTHLSIAK